MGSSLFWFDNWIGLGALYFMVTHDFGVDESVHNVFDVVEQGTWDVDRLLELLPEEYAMQIVDNIKPPQSQNELDKPYWKLETRGYFSVKTSWEYIRRKNEPRFSYRMIWVKGLPFKIAFFMWKVWKEKLRLDDFMRRHGYLMASKCWCCTNLEEETLWHLFLNLLQQHFFGDIS